ncbi:hypothetical protein SODALDRAFT_335592 [Sodiomyces alkalinus F11]|uniref:Uncharacterized protein n=1 Tax=Sodiomyces alkalinus (strain CBS 110278 / VKM F-3762 / F11) TaxID=1314773 RepID=A0A3N2PPR8_SODAK|nr:hypothetical protein SODALDRAFT_335592 [Sodiomyces alkalinus F11]ROT36499.1 hypothetical protein SODALDRAFT_335592 [Sodiomyces alkalinus F11]
MTRICSCHRHPHRIKQVNDNNNNDGRPGTLSLRSHCMSELVKTVIRFPPGEDRRLDSSKDMLSDSLIDGWHSLYDLDEDDDHVTRCAEIIDQCFFGGALTFGHHLDITVLRDDSPFPPSSTVLAPQAGERLGTASVAHITLNPQTFIAHGTSTRRLTFAEVVEQLIIRIAHAYLVLFSHPGGCVSGGCACRRRRRRNATQADNTKHNMAVRRVLAHVFETIQDWNSLLEDFGRGYIDGSDDSRSGSDTT